ncbi:MAG: GNAT family N-acetyltransferase, partial [Actinomycetota bacterium]|nr:GNAT family N-acetyltransferase [Actinomycetota bacterium]
FHTVGRARWHGVDLNRTEEAIWEGLHSSARRAVRKATTDGVEVKVARDRADLRAFFELHLRVRKRKYGLLAQPFGFFERIWEHFLDGHRGALLLGELEGRVVSGVLFLEWQDTLYYKFNASDDAFLASRPNDRVLWEGIRYGCERGLSALDFGLTDWDHEGLIRYKRKYATEERIITAIQHDGDEQQGAARGRQARQLVRQVAGLLADESVPDEVSERAGDLLYRYFT